MAEVHRLAPISRTPGKSTVYGAWERFVRGADDVRGVRPEVLVSWLRCRDRYRVDPNITEAPVAVAEVDHPLEHDVVFAELGFRAATVAHEVSNAGGVVTVTDATGRILAEWGDQRTRDRAAQANLAPWFSWAEGSTGTNGMGTALESHAPVVVRGAEHWCQAFHDWNCAGVAVRDVVTSEPIAALNISCWRNELPDAAGAWLSNAATRTRSTLRKRAQDGCAELIAAYNHARARAGVSLAALDPAGQVVIADDRASVLLGVPGSTPATDPAARWNPGLPELVRVARYAAGQAAHNPDWVGSTQIFTHLADEPTPINIRPVFLAGHLVGTLVELGVSDAEQLPRAEGGGNQGSPPRIVAMRDSRLVLLRHPEISFAESEGNDVWLTTDQGRLRAASGSLDKLESEQGGAGFLRVHRRYVVNIGRVREVERRFKGEMLLVMDDEQSTMVPVSRRNAPAVRRELDL
ncbi:LytTR family transcriptional regulator DNA-binding domain-containing protein [Saccharopolyspora sp. HNM0986]|uniref:DNA-binding protein n=2 Tax=Saccharopolyspora TaxID=1835 RepID=UPI00190A7807|nr:DNA-binding protein [Saccharopolyspora sp. HNM0986]MBK0869111.1 LytTR family transcriptional regulator DNA-binding domain-containing protein [Saccharopolyspora sp. HNM0986]